MTEDVDPENPRPEGGHYVDADSTWYYVDDLADTIATATRSERKIGTVDTARGECDRSFLPLILDVSDMSEELSRIVIAIIVLYLVFDFFFWSGGILSPSILSRIESVTAG